MVFNTKDGKQSSPKKKYRSIEELNMRYEDPSTVETSKMIPKPKSPKKWKKSKVKQIACMFNFKISQIIRRDGGKYSTLINELSPESKPKPKAIFPKPVAMPRTQYTKPKTPVPFPRKKSSIKKRPTSSACFIPEDVFAKLTVKEKALLYTQFVEEMTKKNPKFGLMETRNNMVTKSGEVIAEKQTSVKDLLEELEFNSVFPKPTTAPAKVLQRMDSMKRACAARKNSQQKSKEYEDILQDQTTLAQTKGTPLPRSQNSAIETQSSTDTKQNQTSGSIFQNLQIENLFFSWFKEKHENDNDNEHMPNTTETDEEKQKSVIDKLLEDAIAKLETVETEQNAAVPKPMPRNEKTANQNSNNNSLSTSSSKPSEAEESETSVSSLPKINSDESQSGSQENEINNSENDFDFLQPLKPLCKNKLHKNPVYQKEICETKVNQITSTDSELDGKQTETTLKNKKLNLQTADQEDTSTQTESQPCLELNETLFKLVNSPRKIKSAYTLTINDLETPFCTPRPSLNFAKQPRESRQYYAAAKQFSFTDSSTDQGFKTAANYADSPFKKSESNAAISSTLNSSECNFSYTTPMKTPKTVSNAAAIPPKQNVMEEKAKPNLPVSSIMNLSKGKLGYTKPTNNRKWATNNSNSPLKKTAISAKLQTKSSLSTSLNSLKRNFGYSTPINTTPERHSFAATSSAKRLFSPIAKPIKSRRRSSIYDVESRRNSLVMQVIKEDQPFEPQETRIYSETEQQFIANAPTIENSKQITEIPNGKTSQFWIKCGDFSVTLDINYISSRRLYLLYEIFSQTSCDTKDLHFGIDGNKFSVNDLLDIDHIYTRRIPVSRECSHYWFSTGELAIPFSGKILTTHKIQRLFRAIKETVKETGVLHFGVDDIEFSTIPEFWYQEPKFSVDSQYNMLVGLQSGDSDGLEGRSKYAWPHTMPVMITDLDETDNYDSSKCRRLSSSIFGSNRFDLASFDETELGTPRNSVAKLGLETYCGEYDNEPLDQLFDNDFNQQHQQAWEAAQTKSVPEMIQIVEHEKQRLNAVQEQLCNYTKPYYIAKDSLDIYKGTPEYVEKLKNIVTEISNIGCSGNFKSCTVVELDSYMYFLSRYAELCLSCCNNHMDIILNALANYKAEPPENELQKSHDHNPAALSEHQLRIQASLQRLNIPDWFRQYTQNQKSPDGAGTGASTYKPGSFTRKRTQDSGRWVGLNSKTTSLSSLGSQRSDRSPLLLSPSAHSHHGGQSTQHAAQHGHATGTGTTASSGGAFSRWSTSHLNSSQTSPSVSQRGSFSRGGPINSSFMSVNSGHSVIRNSMRQPYFGWRSQEKLSQRTAHERLASSLLSQQQRTPSTTHIVPANNDTLQTVTPEIQSSIKEVTSAIVHYVNDQTNQQRSRSTSPNSRKCWLESSFVGTRPLDSPQTPIIENTPLITACQAAAVASSSLSTLRPVLLNSNNNNINNNNNNLQYINHNIDESLSLSTLTGNEIQLTRMNGGLNNGTSSSSAGGINLGVERSLSNASLGDVLTSLLGLHTHQTGPNASDAYARSSTGGVLVSESQTPAKQSQQQQQIQHHMPQEQPLSQQLQNQQHKENLLVISKEEQQRLRRHSEGDAATKQKQQQQVQQKQQEQQQQQFEQKSQHYATNAKTCASDSITSITNTHTTANGHAGGATTFLPPRRVSLGDSSESNNRTASASGELQIKCRNNKCDRTSTPADAKKYYKSCHNCTYLYCSRECRRAHWEKHRKACLHSRVSNLCRQVLASCKDDSDSLRHLSLLARKGFLSQGRGVVRILFRSPEAAEGFIKNGFQCMGEASYVRWPDLMPAEMGLELYSELLKLSTEYRPDSKMLVYVAVCVVSEAPGMGQAPVRWERQLVSRCAKLKICKSVLAELEQQQPLPQPITVVAVPEPNTEVLILTFNPQLRNSTAQRELVLSNILDILSRRGVILRKHYPEIFQRLQTYTEGQTDKFNPVTLHPRDSHTGQNFVCIIMPVQSETEIIKLPSIADGGNRVTTIDVGSSAALAQLDDDELLTRTATTIAS